MLRFLNVRAALIIAAFGTLLQSSPALPQVQMQGTTDCAEWMRARATGTSMALQYFVVGMLNGLALASGREFWSANGQAMSREAVYGWMDAYCKSHADQQVLAGTRGLFQERTGWQPPK